MAVQALLAKAAATVVTGLVGVTAMVPSGTLSKTNTPSESLVLGLDAAERETRFGRLGGGRDLADHESCEQGVCEGLHFDLRPFELQPPRLARRKAGRIGIPLCCHVLGGHRLEPRARTRVGLPSRCAAVAPRLGTRSPNGDGRLQ